MLALLTFVSPVVGMVIIFVILSYHFNKPIPQNLKKLTIPLAFCMAQFGYCLNPDLSDLTRYYAQMTQYSGYLNSIFINDSQGLYTRDVLMYLVNRTGDERLLAYIVGFIIYGIAFYILFDMVERNREFLTMQEVTFMMLIILGIVLPTSTIANVRNITAYMMISYATYRDIIQKKKNLFTIFLYIAPLFLHNAAIFMLIIRLLQVIAKKAGTWCIALALFFPLLVNTAYKYIELLPGKLLQSGVQKAYVYLNWTDGGYASEIQGNIMNYVVRGYGAFYILLVLGLIVFSTRKKEVYRIIDQPMVSYVVLVAVSALGCLYITTGAFWRFEVIVMMLCPIYLIPIFKLRTQKVKSILFILFISVMAMVSLNTVIYFLENGLSMFGKYLTGSGFIIIYDVVKGIVN